MGAELHRYIGDPQSLTASFNEQMEVAKQIAYRRFQIMVGDRYGVGRIRKYLITTQPIPDAMVRCPQPCTMPKTIIRFELASLRK